MRQKSLPQALRALEYALAEAQYLATLNCPLDKEAAKACLGTLDDVQRELTDLASFVRKQTT